MPSPTDNDKPTPERQRSEELEQVIKSRNRMMRGFTHDLKNPIGAADGHAALLEDGLLGELSPEQLNSVKRIRASLAGALKLIDTLNEFARVESGRLELRSAPTQVTEIARELAEQHRATAEQSEVQIDMELDKVPMIVTDDERVRQILGNLLSNAIKYTDGGGRVCIRTGMRDSDAEETCIVVDVEDTGIGISDDVKHLLFQEFERIDPSVKPGLGLGLAISRRVARALGGDITVESARGSGSTFTLWLPNRT
jgi:signal transduction histidine kinase